MNEILIYQSSDDLPLVQVQFDGDTCWLTQEEIAKLFNRDRTVITKHLNKIFKEGELIEEVVRANFAHTTKHGAIQGKTQEKSIKYCNLFLQNTIG